MRQVLKHVCRSGNDFEARLPEPDTVRGGSLADCAVRWDRQPSAADTDECEQVVYTAVLRMADDSVQLLAVYTLPYERGPVN
jgi:hypothetical protein